MNDALSLYLADLLPLLASKGLPAHSQKPIQYGIQIDLSTPDGKLLLNVYQSKKTGVSTLIQGSRSHPYYAVLARLVSSPQVIQETIPLAWHEWHSYIGSDECGKGDYFGPLIVCSFYLKHGDAPRLRELGVCDSKMLDTERILRLAPEIFRLFPEQSQCLILKPAKYNSLYESFKREGKNLNDLLAWAHASNISELVKRFPTAEGVVIDQFSPSRKASQAVKKLHPLLPIIERPGAEADVAVATASILARFQLITAFRDMEKKWKLPLAKGAGKPMLKSAAAFVAQYGKARLDEVAKLHFKTTAIL